MSDNQSSGIWIWPFLGFIDVLWMFLLKISPNFRESMSFGLTMTQWFQATIFVLVLLFIIALWSILTQVKSASTLYNSSMEELGPPLPMPEEDIIEAEIIDAEVVEEPEEKPKKVERKRIYEYPPVPEPGINVDTFVKVAEGFIVKIRTKVADEKEI